MVESNRPDRKVRTGATRWLVREIFGNLILIAILFGLSGSWAWWNGWALAGIYLGWSILTAVLILPVNPAMLAERARPHRDTKAWDRVMLTGLGMATILVYVIAGLDARWGWSPPLPFGAQLAGLVVAALGYDGLLVWSMVSNAFFVATVRIQLDRRQTVVSGGPYAIVRHPGYLGTILFHLAAPFLLDSLLAGIPAILAVLVLVVRTRLEDRTLQDELPGYEEFARQVRYRLLPGIW